MKEPSEEMTSNENNRKMTEKDPKKLADKVIEKLGIEKDIGSQHRDIERKNNFMQSRIILAIKIGFHKISFFSVKALMKAKPLSEVLGTGHKLIHSTRKSENEMKDFGYSIAKSGRSLINILTGRKKVEVDGKDRVAQLLERLDDVKKSSREELAIKKKLLKAIKQIYKKDLGLQALSLDPNNLNLTSRSSSMSRSHI